MSRRSQRVAARQANESGVDAPVERVEEGSVGAEALSELEDPDIQAVNPMYERFLEFQRFEAFMRAVPAPVPEPVLRHVPMPMHDAVRREPVVDPGIMVAMSQVKTPTLDGLKIAQIKAFRVAYRRYESKCIVAHWKRLPGQLVLPEHLLTIARVNGIIDVDEVRDKPVSDFFVALFKIHNATMTCQCCRLVEEVKMKSSTWSLKAYLEYAEEFQLQCQLAGPEFAPPQKEMVKMFVKGLRPEALQTEIRRRQ